MSEWICEACGHNSSQHRHEWNKFRGDWNTSCKVRDLRTPGSDVCKCSKFTEKKEEATA